MAKEQLHFSSDMKVIIGGIEYLLLQKNNPIHSEETQAQKSQIVCSKAMLGGNGNQAHNVVCCMYQTLLEAWG